MLSVLAALQLLLVAAPPVTRLPALHVLVASDGALPCAANGALRGAIALRLPSVRLATGRPEPEDLIASLGRLGGAWWFEVKRPSGAVAMSRALHVESDCAQLADTAVLILERYLAAVDWRGRPVGIELSPAPVLVAKLPAIEPNKTGGPVAPPSTPREAVAPTPDFPAPARASTTPRGLDRSSTASPPEREPSGAVRALSPTGRSGTQIEPGESGLEDRAVALGSIKAVPAVVAPEPAVAEAVALPLTPTLSPTGERETRVQVFSRWSVSAGGGGWFGIPTEAAGALSFEVAVLLFERVRFSLVFAGGTALERPLENRGSLRVQSFVGLATATLCGGQRLFACGGLAGGAQLTTGAIGSTPLSGQRIYQRSNELLPLGVLGLYGRLALAIAGPLELALDLAGLIPVGFGSFTIEGFPTPAYTTPPVELIAGLRLGWKFY